MKQATYKIRNKNGQEGYEVYFVNYKKWKLKQKKYHFFFSHQTGQVEKIVLFYVHEVELK